METKLTLEVRGYDRMNFALQQNYIPFIRSILVKNTAGSVVEGAVLHITAQPGFARPLEIPLPSSAPDEMLEVSPVRLAVLPEFLFSLTERLAGNLHITAVRGEEILGEADHPLELLAYDQWTGTLVMPEITAAFITPNHPAVAAVTAKASLYLKKWLQDPAFTGYQTRNPNIVKKQAAAIYAALQQENIAYHMPPASYETVGQRVRLPHKVLEQKCGTCLDLALLYAACLEAAGLHPLVIFIHGHAFAGFWLEEETFGECAVDDVSALTKRMASGIDSICLVECTDFVAGRSCDFDGAESHAAAHLQHPENFELVLDIRRCRASGIRPIPVPVVKDGVITAVDYGKRDAKEITDAPREIAKSQRVAEGEVREVTRQVIWERKLLDLSLRNSLLNFRPSASNVQFMTDDLAELENVISKGEDFRICPVPQEMHLQLSDSRIFETENHKDQISAIAEAEFRNRRLRTFLSESELERVLKKLHRDARVSMEENGANTLYLALGFLRWYETDKSEKLRYAPLVLIPVDLIRKIQNRSYSLRIRGEDAQMNVTLLEMLRQDFGIVIGGLNPLPEDESGADLPLVFNTIRQAVMSRSRWDIEELAFLGQFSFSQFIMWNDIRCRSEELKQNKVVSSLIHRRLDWEPASIDLAPAALDEKITPADMAVPTSADSSQLAAIYAASMGESFVLHGPPGTGKSQTITNMIANALYHGKSVLFVAEKMAALSVVQKRLAAIGLAPFCLELHSNKTQKRAVLSQLQRTLETGHIKSPEEYEKTAEALKKERQQLNAAMSALHETQKMGFSLYDAIVTYDTLQEQQGAFHMEEGFAESCDGETYEKIIGILQKAAAAGRECGGYSTSLLKQYGRREYSIEIRDSFQALCKRFRELLPTAERGFEALGKALDMPLSKNYDSVCLILSVLRSAISGAFLPGALEGDALKSRDGALSALLETGKTYAQQKAAIAETFAPTVFALDARKEQLSWKQNEQKWFLPKYFGKKKLVKTLAAHGKDPAAVNAGNYLTHLQALIRCSENRETLRKADAGLTGLLGDLWKQEDSDFADLDILRQKTMEILTILEKSDDKPGMRAMLQRLSADSDYREGASAALSENADVFAALRQAVSELKDSFSVDFGDIAKAENWFDEASVEADGWQQGIACLRERSILQVQLDALHTLGQDALCIAYREGKITEDTLENAFRCGAARSLISYVLHTHPALSEFQGTQFEVSLAGYRETAAKFQQLTVQELAARLSARIPAAGEISGKGSSELAILQRAIKSGGRMLSIRRLFDSIPALLRRLCPCMLMSPISVAQYIDPKFPKFDLVIFDEASQMPTSEAVGAIARGENVVVVGDPNQLPPTSFFTSGQVDEENYDKEDLESVLDDCLALSMPQKHLLWHYRSRHESLIAFSNARFYENRLLTFPSPDDQVSRVTWKQVEGFYDKGKTRQNRAEAEAVVAEIVRRLSDAELRKESLGVVTFSVVQQNLIDDLLAEEYRKDPRLEQWADEMYEPIFIKNLENVQGDERDVILFSICYGPDQDGRISMNFGPLNKDGGWRRLNVAVSRARKGMQVYSVIRPEQIDLSRSRSEGVAQVRAFLEFAARGSQPLTAAGGDTDGFAELAAQALRERGYTVKCGIGRSGYKVDAAVVDPEDPDRYILGLLCDSRALYDSTTSRDRNILQPSVLSGLGWQLCHVHILDWLDSREKVLDKIEKAIAGAKSGSGKPAEEVRVDYSSFAFEQDAPEEENVAVYEECSFPVMGNPDAFYAAATKRKITSCLQKIIQRQAPVSRRAAVRQTAAVWGITRVTSKVEKAFDEAAAGIRCDEGFFWRDDQDPAAYAEYRIPGKGEKRSMEDICPAEIAAGIRSILRKQIAMQKSDLIRETAKLFGFTRIGTVIESSAEKGIACAARRGWIVCETDGRITIAE